MQTSEPTSEQLRHEYNTNEAFCDTVNRLHRTYYDCYKITPPDPPQFCPVCALVIWRKRDGLEKAFNEGAQNASDVTVTMREREAKPPFAASDGSNASIVEAIKETDRHMEELYRQAGEGRIVTEGLTAARERAGALTQALIQSKHLNADISRPASK